MQILLCNFKYIKDYPHDAQIYCLIFVGFPTSVGSSNWIYWCYWIHKPYNRLKICLLMSNDVLSWYAHCTYCGSLFQQKKVHLVFFMFGVKFDTQNLCILKGCFMSLTKFFCHSIDLSKNKHLINFCLFDTLAYKMSFFHRIIFLIRNLRSLSLLLLL